MRLPLPEHPGRDPAARLAALRRAMAEAAGKGVWSTSPPPDVLNLGGVRVLRHAATGPVRGAVLHFHGGGYRMGMPEAVAPFARRLADTCAVDVYCPAYRLAPECPFPASFNDGWVVATLLAEQYAGRLIMAGDSAGGGLAASLVPVLARSGTGLLGLMLHSPWLDLTVSSPSYVQNARSDPMFSQAAATEAAELYLQERYCADNPLVSPLFADPAAFPSTLITVGTGEVLHGDANAMHDRLRAIGTDVWLVQVDGMDHVAVTRGPNLPGSAEALTATRAFLKAVLER